MLGAVAALVLLINPDQALAASCKMTSTQIEAVGALPDPVTTDASGVFIRDGATMSDFEVQRMCLTRRYADLVAAKEAAGKRLKAINVGGFLIDYLSTAECIDVRHVSNVARNGGAGESATEQAANEDSCQKEAGRRSTPSL